MAFGRNAILTLAAHAAAALSTAAATPALAAEARPRLIVAIAVDQFGSNLFDQWRSRFKGGLHRLSNGVAYPSGYQSHAATETCPGHSTLLTGKHPNKTGLVGNNFRDPSTGRSIYCLLDPSKVLAHGGKGPSVGPQLLMATTLGDWLKAASPQSRVVAVSGKDRAAITMAGHQADGVFWLQGGFGFTTYMNPGDDVGAKLAPVAGLNARIAKTWTARPAWTYTHKDCRALAGPLTIDGQVWRSQLPPTGWGASTDPEVIRGEVMNSPIADDLTLAAANTLIDGFRLGRGPAVDLLAISFSATDFVGHRYGTAGPEMCEQLYRLDAGIGALLAHLDALGTPYLVVLTADHGGSDVAERLQAQGFGQAARVDGKAVLARANRAAMAELNLPAPPLSGSIEEVDVAAPDPADRARITTAAVRALAAQPEVAAAFSQEELLATPIPRGKPADELSLRERFAESTYPGRSADIQVALQPYMSGRAATPGATIAGHGSVWNYDRRVPILFWWNGAPQQERPLPIETVDIAPTLAAVLGLAAPADLDGRCLPIQPATCAGAP